MTTYASADLEDLEEFFVRKGFHCSVETVGPFPRVLLAEDPYTLLLVVEAEGTDGLERSASDAQAELTKLVSQRVDPMLRWDLYVVIHVRTNVLTSLDARLVEKVSSDTAYARKLVRINLEHDDAALTKALRSFLPIHHSGAVDYDDPLGHLAKTMLALGAAQTDVESAFATFQASGQVKVP